MRAFSFTPLSYEVFAEYANVYLFGPFPLYIINGIPVHPMALCTHFYDMYANGYFFGGFALLSHREFSVHGFARVHEKFRVYAPFVAFAQIYPHTVVLFPTILLTLRRHSKNYQT